MTLAALDFSNAFNEIERSMFLVMVRDHFPAILDWVLFTYGSPARLYYEGQHLLAHTSVQQGDPLGPFLFALGLHSLVLRLRAECDLHLMSWFLDDGTIIGPTREVLKALHLLTSWSTFSGLRLNLCKTQLFWQI